MREEITGTDHAGIKRTVRKGDRVRVYVDDGHPLAPSFEDEVRSCFINHVLLAPYAANKTEPAVGLHKVSWVPVRCVEVLS